MQWWHSAYSVVAIPPYRTFFPCQEQRQELEPMLDYITPSLPITGLHERWIWWPKKTTCSLMKQQMPEPYTWNVYCFHIFREEGKEKSAAALVRWTRDILRITGYTRFRFYRRHSVQRASLKQTQRDPMRGGELHGTRKKNPSEERITPTISRNKSIWIHTTQFIN